MSSMDRTLVQAILKHCFPKADTVRIVYDTLEDGERHLSSDINRFTVEYEQDGRTERSHLIMKVPTSSAMSSVCHKLNLYDTEINMYERVLPAINKYLEKSLAPAHLHTTDSKILVLEDISARGYKSGEKLPPLNFPQAEGTMKAFAHFHAASHKIAEVDLNILDKNMSAPDFEEVDSGKLMHSLQLVVLELLEKNNELSHLISKLEAVIVFLKKDGNEIRALLDESKFKFGVLNHGDGRKDNFLFKQTSNEVKVQLIDFQGCFWCTPAYDIIRFLMTSVSVDVIEAHFDDLIDGYLAELNMKLKKLECTSTYERVDFDDDFKSLKYFLLASFFGSCILVSPLSREQVENLLVRPELDASYLSDLCLNDEKFVHFVYGWIKYFEKSNLLDEM